MKLLCPTCKNRLKEDYSNLHNKALSKDYDVVYCPYCKFNQSRRVMESTLTDPKE